MCCQGSWTPSCLQKRLDTQAEEWLIRAGELDPTNPRWKESLGHHYMSILRRIDEQERQGISLKALHCYESAFALTGDEVRKAYLLKDLAECAFFAEEYTSAEDYASRLLSSAPLFEQNGLKWNYGNVVHWGHIYLGKIALIRGDKEGALRHLQEAAKTPGSPQLNSFGPDKTLAASLLEVGENEDVLEYFRACGSFWKMEMGRLTYWTDAIKNGQVIDFKSTDWFTSKEVS